MLSGNTRLLDYNEGIRRKSGAFFVYCKKPFFMRYFSFLLVALIFLAALTTSGQTRMKTEVPISTGSIDWESFLKGHDLVWDTITADYYAGAIMGNGLLGNSVYKENGAYKLHVGRVDVTEGRMPDDVLDYHNLYHGARLPIGYFLLKTGGKVIDDNMRLSLWNAETTGSISTEAGKLGFTSYVHSTKDVIILETQSEGKGLDFEWEWKPLKAVSPRYVFGQTDYPQEYVQSPNPEVKCYEDGNYGYSVQNLVGGKSYAVVWHDDHHPSHRRILITIAHENSEQEAVEKAKQTIADALATDRNVLVQSHRDWWHNYYPASFASFGDAKMESFYWIQQYKFACLTRPDRFIIDLQGPWAMEKTPWPAIWVNLNIQLTYSPLFTANRSSLSLPVWKALNDNIGNLKKNVVVPEWNEDAITMGRSTSYHLVTPLKKDSPNKAIYETGNLPWLLFYYWQYCRWQGDDNELKDRFFPLLKGSIAYYGHIREKGDDGLYHLPETASPEYASARDCNYDLALLRWGLATLIDINQKYGLNDGMESYWKDFLANLTPYPSDPKQGYMIGENVYLTSSHRHYSHLLMIYPLYEINWDSVGYHDIISKSVEHWQSMPAYLQGYSFTGSSSIYSMMGDGDRAVGQLQKLIDKFIKPNTLYRETGPVIETPLAGASSLQDLYLQSWGGTIRVFPAVPDKWTEASFIDFRADGAFLVSASRAGGKTNFICIKSEKGGVCRLKSGMEAGKLTVKNKKGKKIEFSVLDPEIGLVEFATSPGDVITISQAGRAVTMPAPVIHPEEELNRYGVRTGKG
jgi:hypothetical protein